MNLLKNIDMIEKDNKQVLFTELIKNIDDNLKMKLLNTLIAVNNLKVSVKLASDNKFIVVTSKKSFCISFYQLFSNVDRVIKYIRKQL